MDSRISGAVGGAAQGAAAGSAFGPVGIGIGAVAGGLFGGLFGGGGEKEAKKLARLQQKLIYAQQKEQERRQQRQLAQDIGGMTAQVGASGILMTGSTKRYVNEYELEFRRQMAWDRKKAEYDAQTAKYGGQVAVSQIQSAGMQNMFGALGSAASADAFGTFEDGKYKSPFG